MKILVLDNYDSFTYNLVQYITELVGETPSVFRNDKISLEAVDEYDCIILSPGPGLPSEAGIMPELIKKYAPTKRIFGVCLGQQAIGEAFGGELYNLPKVYHGIATPVKVVDKNEAIFKNVPSEIMVGRYHSWAVVKETLPAELKVTAVDTEGVIMALSHVEYDVKGVQFHPESIMTDYGKQILRDFLQPTKTTKGEAIEYVF
ncbi:MAG: aminodeoxychorismate/anthranilate synthase component II [Saprospiraceae bacterium]|nr:aminodeoxychorismate/anthranilate synthase component II [Saprospiraceae bacterium]